VPLLDLYTWPHNNIREGESVWYAGVMTWIIIAVMSHCIPLKVC